MKETKVRGDRGRRPVCQIRFFLFLFLERQNSLAKKDTITKTLVEGVGVGHLDLEDVFDPLTRGLFHGRIVLEELLGRDVAVEGGDVCGLAVFCKEWIPADLLLQRCAVHGRHGSR